MCANDPTVWEWVLGTNKEDESETSHISQHGSADDLWLSMAARKRAAYHDGDGAAQVQARILSKTHREPANKPETTNKLKMKTTNDERRRKETDGKETPKPATEEDKARPV